MSTYGFFITSLIIVLIPGAGVLYTISVGVSKGKKASILATIGCTLGIIPHLFMSIVLSSFILNMSQGIFTAIKIVGALYFLYLGAGMIRSEVQLDLENSQGEDSSSSIVRRGVLISLLNPKITLFFFSFLPQYVSSTEDAFVFQSFLLGGIFIILTLVVFIGYGILAGAMKRLLISPGRFSILQKTFGVAFVIFAFKLALSPLSF